MSVSLRALAIVAATVSFDATSAHADDAMSPRAVESDVLGELDRRADELSESARRTIEEFVNLVGPMLTRLSRLIDDLPTYEAPEILPNGDILIRRKPDTPAPTEEGADDLTET